MITRDSGAAAGSRHSDEQKDSAMQEFSKQAKRLGYEDLVGGHVDSVEPDDLEAKFITAQDPIIKDSSGHRLPVVPVEEAIKLQRAQNRLKGQHAANRSEIQLTVREAKDGAIHGLAHLHEKDVMKSSSKDGPSSLVKNAVAASVTNPLFPPIPIYGPPTLFRRVYCLFLRASSSILSLGFLTVIILGAFFNSIPMVCRRAWLRLQWKDPDAARPFYDEERKRRHFRKVQIQDWARGQRREKRGSSRKTTVEQEEENTQAQREEYSPLEGGPDSLKCDVRYYARRVGLDVGDFQVKTEDGFILTLWHIYNPKEIAPTRPEFRKHASADVSSDDLTTDDHNSPTRARYEDGRKRYPVLMIHGLLQSSGAYCCSNDNSLAFYLAKSGYDVWLGNNRCGMQPTHSILTSGDPRMWAWNIRQMGVLDLPAFMSRILAETGFEKLGLVCHSQGTAQTLVALAKEQRPDLGEHISVFCALAPAAYAGPLIKKAYFKFMQIIPPGMFRVVFGIHAFIPFMMSMHKILPARFYGFMGYLIFTFLFGWSDQRWEKDLRNRYFQFSPVYVSSESMRWWLGRDCFAKHKCILSTKDEYRLEDEEDEEEDALLNSSKEGTNPATARGDQSDRDQDDRSRYAWYDDRAPPFAIWVCGDDKLVDGRRFLRRFERGREPYVHVVHQKVIEGYEHLDVIWAIDAIDKVGKEIKEVIWRTVPASARKTCRTPTDCEGIKAWENPNSSLNKPPNSAFGPSTQGV